MRSALETLRAGIDSNPTEKPDWILLPGHCCQAVGGQMEWTAELSTAWFLFYAAAHLMDNLEDQDQPEAWWKGQPPGVPANVATGLYFSAHSVLDLLLGDPQAQHVAPLIVPDFSLVLLKMCAGQQRDLATSFMNLTDYWEIAQEKSGEFFALACRSGARLGGGTDAEVGALSNYGLHLGILIQILDDLDAARHFLEPQAAHERAHFTHSLPVVFALQFFSGSERTKLLNLLQASVHDLDAARTAFNFIEESGAPVYMAAEIQRHRTECFHSLAFSSLRNPAKETLAGFIEYISH